MPYIPAHGAELIGKIVSQGPRDTVAITHYNIYLRSTEYSVLAFINVNSLTATRHAFDQG